MQSPPNLPYRREVLPSPIGHDPGPHAPSRSPHPTLALLLLSALQVAVPLYLLVSSSISFYLPLSPSISLYLQVAVPPGVSSGQQFQVQLPPAAPIQVVEAIPVP